MRKTKKEAMPERRGAHAVAYVRASAQGCMSREAQIERIKAYCAYKQLELVAVVEESATHALDPLASRPGGAQLLQVLATALPAHVVIVSLDRMFQSALDCLRSVEDWRAVGVSLHMVDLAGSSIDTGSAYGKFFLEILAAFAQYQAEVAEAEARPLP